MFIELKAWAASLNTDVDYQRDVLSCETINDLEEIVVKQVKNGACLKLDELIALIGEQRTSIVNPN